MNILGFALAGAGLLLLADIAPNIAVMTGGTILLGYIITNPASLQQLTMLINGQKVTTA